MTPPVMMCSVVEEGGLASTEVRDVKGSLLIHFSRESGSTVHANPRFRQMAEGRGVEHLVLEGTSGSGRPSFDRGAHGCHSGKWSSTDSGQNDVRPRRSR
jgi:hypothetical protein